jgi:hypothetical protein
MPTLDQMIQQAVFGGGPGKGDPTHVKTASTRKPATTVSEAEKIATTLEFIGKQGVENMVKGASAAPPPGTNYGVTHAAHQQKTVRPHKAAPPMADGGKDPSTNAGSKPGGGGEQHKPRGTGQDHHPALSSSKAATNFDKREKAKIVSGDLSALFDAKPFADGKMKENLTDAAGKGDKNIHKSASVDRDRLKTALARKLAAQEG